MRPLARMLCILLVATTACGSGLAGLSGPGAPAPPQGRDDDLSQQLAVTAPASAAQATVWQSRAPWVNSPGGSSQASIAHPELHGANAPASGWGDASLTLLRLHCQLII